MNMFRTLIKLMHPRPQSFKFYLPYAPELAATVQSDSYLVAREQAAREISKRFGGKIHGVELKLAE